MLRSGILGLDEIQVRPDSGIVGVEYEGFPPFLFGEAVKTLGVIGDAEVQARGDVLRIALLGLVEFLDGLIEHALVAEGNAEMGDDVGEVRRKAEGFPVLFDRFVQKPEFIIQVPEPQMLIGEFAFNEGIYARCRGIRLSSLVREARRALENLAGFIILPQVAVRDGQVE